MLRDVPGQHIALAQDLFIKELNSRVQVLQQQLSIAMQENRTLQHMQRRHAAALHCFQGSQASLTQLLHRHGAEVRALQELLRRSKRSRNASSQKLWSTERELLHVCDAVHRLQFLNQDRTMEVRETLTQNLSVISVELNKQNKSIQDLERNLVVIRGSFHRQQSAEIRRTMEARELSRHLEEEIRNLTQSIKDMEKELKIHNIYSNRFQKSMQRETKENKEVQTDAVPSLPVKAPIFPPETENLPEQKELEKNIRSSREFYSNNTANSSSSENEQMQSEDTSDETLSDNERNLGLHEATPEYNTEEEQVTSSVSRPESNEINSQLDSKSLVTTQSHAETKPGKSPVRIRRCYHFKETILNLHDGKPAYGTGLRFEPSFHLRPKAASILEAGVYGPSFGVTLKTNATNNKGTIGP